MKIFSNSTIYALRALIYIASNEDEQQPYTSISEMSKQMEISFHFLTKSLQKLTKEKILISSRGVSGGIALNKSSSQIKLIEIIKILEGANYFDSCMLGLPGCGVDKPCPFHEFWAEFKNNLNVELTQVSLGDLAVKTIRDRLRLTLI